jgi:2-polyprenyl-3-methyl-5-hydroxy-6-metoxy-1,4-benzoquinol methylase
MINYLHSLFHRPLKGWDPVPASHAEAWTKIEPATEKPLQWTETRIGGFRDKTVLDLGGGPGYYTVAFARAGARTTWFDVSRNYEQIARKRAHDAGVEVEFAIGYLEDAVRLGRSFDLVFINLCWYYCMSDRRFARIVYSLVNPGGAGYIASPWDTGSKLSAPRRLLASLNDHLGIKIGHPFAGHGRIVNLFNSFPLEELHADYRTPGHDIVLFVKPR